MKPSSTVLTILGEAEPQPAPEAPEGVEGNDIVSPEISACGRSLIAASATLKSAGSWLNHCAYFNQHPDLVAGIEAQTKELKERIDGLFGTVQTLRDEAGQTL